MNDLRLWCSDLGDGTFQNPILYADYSDPDVIRVGGTFYMTASSFNYIPGLPILTSKDLVNWELKNYAIKNALPYDTYDSPAHAKGIWAPSIRYRNGEFYIFVGMPDEGIFVLKSKDPLGEWSEPHLLLPGKGYIDPCPVWCEDGTAYVVHAYAKSRIGFKSILGIFPMSEDGMRCLGDDTFIYDGSVENPTIEGPKIYHRNGYFYIFAPAGGVKNGWQVALRSKNIYGPYEAKTVMHQGSSSINGPHQGGLVDTTSGEEWFLHFQDAGVYGRISHLQPVVWENGWPVIGKDVSNSGCGEPQLRYKKPSGCLKVTPTYLSASDDFSSEHLGLQWQWLANAKDEFYSLTARKGALRLYSMNPTGKNTPLLWNCANVLTQKIICPAFTADFSIDISGMKENTLAGIVIIGSEYSALAFRNEKCNLKLVYFESETIKERGKTEFINTNDQKAEKILFSTHVDSSFFNATLRIVFNTNKTCQMYYKLENETAFTKIPLHFAPKNHTWVGVRIGMFSTALEPHIHESFVDFTRVVVKQ
ncbi:MAG: glycosyl hydrolase 43 family protein [Lachnospiraceae bacterium]|nr:glycosyl hydrolase 43 family protein [Lachnospiraceae bacterium]